MKIKVETEESKDDVNVGLEKKLSDLIKHKKKFSMVIDINKFSYFNLFPCMYFVYI